MGRMESTALHNHPVETETAGFNYGNVVRVTDAETTSTEMGSLGHSNNGYVMPYPRVSLQDGKGPICQQCHEDSREIGDDITNHPQQLQTTELWSVTDLDGRNAAGATSPTGDGSDNPGFQTFPHESWNARFLVEVDDDLCLNCHLPPG
jgi:hypothetical protein